MRPSVPRTSPPACHFNPRTPCGVRRGLAAPVRRFRPISIHAPRAGCDAFPPPGPLSRKQISIHAPRAGCDITPGDYLRRPKEFQSTHPVRGATLLQVRGRYVQPISIHAPRAGCDIRDISNSATTTYFNPRTPCGVRPLEYIVSPMSKAFQSTHPVRGATTCIYLSSVNAKISIHAPRAGCDGQSSSHATQLVRFQSTHPVRGATWIIPQRCHRRRISIHAPRAGCDRRT